MANDYIEQWNINETLFDIHDSGRGKPNGVATLDNQGRIPYEQLPESAMELKGYWDASTNTPTLIDGTGTLGNFYLVSVAGSQNLGSGTQYFAVGSRVLYDGSIWKNIDSGNVRTVNNIAPDPQGNIGGFVRSVNGATPDAVGNVVTPMSNADKARMLGPRTGTRYKMVFDTVNERNVIHSAYDASVKCAKNMYVTTVSIKNANNSNFYHSIAYSSDALHWNYFSMETVYTSSCNLIALENYGFIVSSTLNGAYTVFKSTNGTTWTNVTSDMASLPFKSLAKVYGIEFLRFGDNSIKLTRDEGLTFEDVTVPTGDSFTNVTKSKLFYCSTLKVFCILSDNNKVYISSDGLTWQEITYPDGVSTTGSIALIGNKLYISSSNSLYSCYIYRDLTQSSWTTITGTFTGGIHGSNSQFLYFYDKILSSASDSTVTYKHGGTDVTIQTGDQYCSITMHFNGLTIGFFYNNSSYLYNSLRYSIDGTHWFPISIHLGSFIPSSETVDYRQLTFLGFAGGKWFFSYRNAQTSWTDIPIFAVSTLEEDILDNL